MPEQPFEGDEPEAGAGGNWCDDLNSAPSAIVLPVLGMLDGLCGEPVSIWLQDYPPDILGALQRFIREHVFDEMVCEVFGPSDLRRLIRGAGNFAIVLVYPIPDHSSAGLVAQRLLESCRRARLPMALLSGERCDREAPGAIVSLRAGPAETARLRTMLAAHPLPDRRVREFLSRPRTSGVAVGFDGLSALFGPAPDAL